MKSLNCLPSSFHLVGLTSNSSFAAVGISPNLQLSHLQFLPSVRFLGDSCLRSSAVSLEFEGSLYADLKTSPFCSPLFHSGKTTFDFQLLWSPRLFPDFKLIKAGAFCLSSF